MQNKIVLFFESQGLGEEVSLLIFLYLLGTLLVGLPMALVSFWCYKLENDLDDFWWLWPLKIARNFLHPGSFLFLADYELGDPPKRNYRINYEGPISDVLDNLSEPGAVMYYLIVSSLMWPVRLYISLVASAVYVALVIIASPFYILKKFCDLICWACRLISEIVRNYYRNNKQKE